ncbi:cuticle protein 16.8 [Belonocnema kinseyi]|uniref:cuticle protein 16.8 n=1 Tax=Belonocnema kinseyi TaxID=2817044 RepID=UPI00143CEB35|nr:cuticle protein 16.8 [Belonocnema kinseyi]
MYPAIILLILASPCLGDVSHILSSQSEYVEATTPPPAPRPYSFEYTAGRFPGHVDRAQKEYGDGAGTIYGSYSYLDPKLKVRTVEYKADKNGFQPSLINYEDVLAPPEDSEAVRLAKERHYALYARIANNNARGVQANPPLDSVSVARAKDRHHHLYQKIAAEHAAIAHQREGERLAYEATSVPNDVNESHNY